MTRRNHAFTAPVAGGVTTNYVPNDLNQLASFSDTAGRSVSFGYDGNGNRATRTENGGTDGYGYDLENRLTSLDKGGVRFSFAPLDVSK